MNHYAIKTSFRGESDSFPVYAWGKTPEEAICGLKQECLNAGQRVTCELDTALTEKLQAEHKRYNSLPWWKKPFDSFKYPHS